MPQKTVEQGAGNAQQELFVTQELMPADAQADPFATQEAAPADAPAETLATQEPMPQDAPADAPAEPFVTEEVTPEGNEMPGNLQEMVERNIELRRDNRELKERTDRNNAELTQLDKVIIEQFAARRLQQQKMETGETMYVQKSIYASLVRDGDGEHNGAHQALRDSGLEWLVEDKVNSTSLSAWVREQKRQESEIPEGLMPFLNISEIYRLRVRM